MGKDFGGIFPTIPDSNNCMKDNTGAAVLSVITVDKAPTMLSEQAEFVLNF